MLLQNLPKPYVKPGVTFFCLLILSACGGGGGSDSSGGSGGGTPSPVSYTVSTSAGNGGSLSPASRSVQSGQTTTFTVSADTGYSIASVTGCGGSLSGSTYTTGSITSNCTVAASFNLNNYTVTANAGEGGSISPSSVIVTHGSTATFEVTAESGYSIASVTGCGGSLSGSAYTTGSITSNCAVTANFNLNSYTVTATAGEGGSISPGSAGVIHGSTATFEVTANSGYSIASVTGCGGSLSGSTYTTGSITSNCTVTASFSLDSYTVTAIAGEGGGISPESVTVNYGDKAEFTISLEPGYAVYSTGGCEGKLNGMVYTTEAITEECSVNVSFGSAAGNSQALIGSLSGASIDVYKLSDLTQIIESTTAYIDHTDVRLAGTFSLILEGIDEDEWLLIAATGGEDIDPEMVGTANQKTEPLNGTIHALVRASDVKEGITINPLTELAYQAVLSHGVYNNSAELMSFLDDFTKVLKINIDPDKNVGYRNLTSFIPWRHKHLLPTALWSDMVQYFISDLHNGYSPSELFNRHIIVLSQHGNSLISDGFNHYIRKNDDEISLLTTMPDGAGALNSLKLTTISQHESSTISVYSEFDQEITQIQVNALEHTFSLMMRNETSLLERIIPSDDFKEASLLPSLIVNHEEEFIEVDIPGELMSSFERGSILLKQNGALISKDSVEVIQDNPIIRIRYSSAQRSALSTLIDEGYIGEEQLDGLILTLVGENAEISDGLVEFLNFVNDWSTKVSALNNFISGMFSAIGVDILSSEWIDKNLIEKARKDRRGTTKYAIGLMRQDGTIVKERNWGSGRFKLDAGEWYIPIIAYNLPLDNESGVEDLLHRPVLKIGSLSSGFHEEIPLPYIRSKRSDPNYLFTRLVIPNGFICFDSVNYIHDREIIIDVDGGAVNTTGSAIGRYSVYGSENCGPKARIDIENISNNSIMLNASLSLAPEGAHITSWEWDVLADGMVDHYGHTLKVDKNLLDIYENEFPVKLTVIDSKSRKSSSTEILSFSVSNESPDLENILALAKWSGNSDYCTPEFDPNQRFNYGGNFKFDARSQRINPERPIGAPGLFRYRIIEGYEDFERYLEEGYEGNPKPEDVGVFSDLEKSKIIAVMNSIARVSGVTFVEADKDDVDVMVIFKHTGFSYKTVAGAVVSSRVLLDYDYVKKLSVETDWSLPPNRRITKSALYGEMMLASYVFDGNPTGVITHEFLHALGIGHPFPYAPQDCAPYIKSLGQDELTNKTVMSYRRTINQLGPFDVMALRYLYGLPQ